MFKLFNVKDYEECWWEEKVIEICNKAEFLNENTGVKVLFKISSEMILMAF
jgi:hypothetical protein